MPPLCSLGNCAGAAEAADRAKLNLIEGRPSNQGYGEMPISRES
jgi:hypothetical protein